MWSEKGWVIALFEVAAEALTLNFFSGVWKLSKYIVHLL